MLLFISILSFAVALLLAFFNRNRYAGNYYLVGFFLINAVAGIQFYALFFSPSVTFTAIMHGHFMPILYLSGPMAFFYVRSLITDNSRLKKTDLLHFIPFFILFIGMIPYYFKDFDYKVDLVQKFFDDPSLYLTNINFLVPQSVNIISKHTIVMLYFAAALRIWILNKEVIHQKTLLSGLTFKHIYSWVQIFISLSFLVSLGMLILAVNSVYRFSAHLSFDRMTFLLNFMGLFFFLLNISLFVFPEILYGMPRYRGTSVLLNTDYDDQADDIPGSSVETETNRMQLSEDYQTKIKHLISIYLEEKPFLNKEFNMTLMSSETTIPIHHLSYYFNNILHNSFSDWRNRLRIEYSVQLMNNGFAKDHSLNAVSLESGFASQVTFIRAFKIQTNQTPGEYLKSVR